MNRLPCLLLPARASCPHSSVIVLHGYSARGAVMLGDAEALRGEHTEVVLPDAPGHGARDDGTLARIGALPDGERHAAILDVARQWRDELSLLVVRCRQRGARRVALVGISMGGFAALGALAAPCPLVAVAALLAAPTLVDDAAITPGCPPLLLGLAGRDIAVPPQPGRTFASRYGAELLEYPESEHLMRGEDWCELWARTVGFVRRQLARV